jgi:hypothetical protein
MHLTSCALMAPLSLALLACPTRAEMADAAEGAGKPLILINPKLTDIQSAGGVGSVRGRQGRLDFIATFVTAFHFRLLYRGAAMHPIMGALRYEYGGPWEVSRHGLSGSQGRSVPPQPRHSCTALVPAAAPAPLPPAGLWPC